MSTVVNGLAKLNATMAPSQSTESPATPFSMTDLLREQPQSEDTHSLDIDLTDFQERMMDDSVESPEESDNVIAADWIAYWNLIPNPQDPLPVLSLSTENTSTQSRPLDLMTASFQDNVDNVVIQAPSLVDDSLADYNKSAPFRLFESPLLTTVSSSIVEPKTLGLEKVVPQLTDNANNAIQPSLDILTPTDEPQAFMQSNVSIEGAAILEPLMQEIVNNKQVVVEEDTLKHSIDLKNFITEEMHPIDTPQVRRIEPAYTASDVLPQYESIVKPHETETLSLESNHADLSQSPTINMQALTQHINDFLTQGMSKANIPVQGEAVGAHEQIKMELLSIKPEPFVNAAGLKLEQYTAQIKVHPQELGPITAKIEVNDGVTTITFLTDHVHVKQLMESNLPELKHAFQQSHLQLDTVNVHHGGSQDKKGSSTYVHPEDEDNVDEKTRKTGSKSLDSRDIKTNRSIIDTYA